MPSAQDWTQAEPLHPSILQAPFLYLTRAAVQVQGATPNLKTITPGKEEVHWHGLACAALNCPLLGPFFIKVVIEAYWREKAGLKEPGGLCEAWVGYRTYLGM
jgi:hypothetical protein